MAVNQNNSLLLKQVQIAMLFLLHVLMLTSCSTYRIANHHVTRTFERSGMQHDVVTINDNEVDYWDTQADKPVLLLIHGFGSSASFQWFKQIKALEKDYRIIVPNLLYFGDSKPLSGTKYDLQQQVDMLHDLMAFLKVDRLHVCGVSYGGLVAAEWARQFPHSMLSLTLFDAPLKFYDITDVEAICTKYGTQTVQDFFVPENGKGMKKLLSAGFRKPPAVPAVFLESFLEAQYGPNAEHLKKLLVQLQSDEEHYARMNYGFPCPVLLIWGEGDDIVGVNRGNQLHRYLIGSEFYVIPKTKHLPNLERPKQFNAIFLEFLNGVN